MVMRAIAAFVALMMVPAAAVADRAVDELLERVSPGLSGKIRVEIVPDSVDYYELSQDGVRPLVRANNRVSAAYGVHRYLRRYVGVHLCWNDMYGRELADTLPAVTEPESRVTDMGMRYYLNYCTHSYSMAFWDRERWRREIDWMALHGINMPLAITGMESVWLNVLTRLGYGREEARTFVAGPAFQAWWLMNNLEGWGGPDSDDYYDRRAGLQRYVLDGMRSLDMEPVLPGYSGMVPHDAGERQGLNVQSPGRWLGYVRPGFLQPTDSAFARVAAIYYDELHALCGRSRYYSMDPFHEGGNTEGVDLDAAGRAIVGAMKRANDEGVWVLQAWQDNPRRAMIDSLAADDVVVLDLCAESRPQCGDSLSVWYRPEGFGNHKRLWCMLLNFGGNVGMYGKLRHVADAFGRARLGRDSATLGGMGLTMEGIENNPVMYELMCDLAWEAPGLDVERWLGEYLSARYGAEADEDVAGAWALLVRSVYGCPAYNLQQGTAESVFCARPSDNPVQASSWLEPEPYYDGADVIAAARLMVSAAERYGDNRNFVYDLVDVTRQAVAERARMCAGTLSRAVAEGDSALYRCAADTFMCLLDMQDRLLGSLPDFRVGRWLDAARRVAASEEEADRLEWNARLLVSVWGTREAADRGGLHDYGHREWQGMLRDYYGPRWRRWFDERLAAWGKGSLPQIDFYAMEREWADGHRRYSPDAEGNAVTLAREAVELIGR